MTKLSRKLSLELLEVTDSTSLNAWIAKVKAEARKVSWREVGSQGGNDIHNIGVIEAGSKKLAPLLERVTNCQDAIMELARTLYKGDTKKLSSPAEAWKILSELLGLNDKEIARLINVSIHKGNDKDNPTISFRDRGIGQNPSSFPHTLMGLLKNNKGDKPWLHGDFCMGGSSAYGKAYATIVISKRHRNSPDHDGEVGATVVLKGPDEYRYLVDEDNEVFRLDLPEWEDGTEARLVEYPLSGYTGRANDRTGSILSLFQSGFPKPTIPFSVEEKRASVLKTPSGQKNQGPKVVNGICHLLRDKIGADGKKDKTKSICEYTDEKIPLDLKGVKINSNPISEAPDLDGVEFHMEAYLVKDNKGKNPEYYTRRDSHVIFTLNGQRQASLSRDWIEKKAGLGHIKDKLICVVECSPLPKEVLGHFFSSTRESMKDGQVAEKIVEKVSDALTNDPHLREYDRIAGQRKYAQAAGLASKNVLDNIKKNISSHFQQAPKKDRQTTGQIQRTPRSKDDSQLNHIPTEIKIVQGTVSAPKGRKAYLTLEIDAKNGYLPAPGRKISVFSDQLGELKASHGILKGGVLGVGLNVPDDTEFGRYDIKVQLSDLTGSVPINLNDKAALHVYQPQKGPPKKNKRGKGATGKILEGANINPVWKERKDWEELGWDENTVGECSVSKNERGFFESITVLVNQDYPNFQELLSSAANKDEIMEKYMETIFWTVLKTHEDEEIVEKKNSLTISADAVIQTINPKIVKYKPDEVRQTPRHSVPALGLRTDTDNMESPSPRRDIRNHSTFTKEMQRVEEGNY